MDMNTFKGYAICYPQIQHPLRAEKEDLKKKYIFLLKYYADKFCPGDQVVLYRLKTFALTLFGTKELANFFPPDENINKLTETIMKTCVTPFWVYLFLFDCIFIMAIDDEVLGENLCNELKSTVDSRYHYTLNSMKQKMYLCDSNLANIEFITDEMAIEWNRARRYINAQNRNITFTANMSAGKSTLINAIIGKELSYAKKAACTATVMKFITSPTSGIYSNIYFDEQVKQFQTESDVREFTKDREIPCSINSFFFSPLSSQRITLIDTPGVNSAQNPKHMKITREELTSGSTDILVYVISVECYGSEDDYVHLSYIKKKVDYSIIVFVVNMMDLCDSEDDSVSEIITNIREHLTDIGFESPIICPMSAKAGMLIKQALYGSSLSENAKKACTIYVDMLQNKDLELGALYPPVKKVNSKKDTTWLAPNFDKIWSAYINTGLPGFETLLLSLIKESEIMLEVIIEYNPYKVASTITVNGEKPKKNSKLNQFLNQRFQLWVDQVPFLLAEEYNDDKFDLTFFGTELDYQDLLAAIEIAEKNDIYFRVKKIDAKEFGDKEKDIRELFEQVRKLPFEELQSAAVLNAFELAFNELLEVNVVAPMSAGKSTLINALLGKRLLPSKQGACTAIITKVQDDDDDTFKAIAIDANKNEIEHYSVLDYETMKALNGNPEISEVQVRGNIPFVTSKEVSLVLIDTPGPNNARDKKHGLVTAKALDQSSKMLVLFVMNGGTLHTADESALLERIAKSMSVGGKQSRERFMFVINKMDGYKEEDDDIANETIPDVIKYLEDRGIENPNIFPAAAEPALLIRRYLNTFEDVEKEKLLKEIENVAEKLINQKQLHLETYPHLVRSCQTKIDDELATAIQNNDILGQALIHSGIRGIEESIRMYVTKYCRPAKITNLVNTFKHELDSAEAFENTKKEVASRQTEQKELEAKINKLTQKLTSKSENEAFKKKVFALEITSKLTGNVDSLIAEVEESLTNFFSQCPGEMEEEEAMDYIRKFTKLANDKQNEFQESVNCLLHDDIKAKSQQLLEEYIKKLAVLSEEFSEGSLTIDLASFVQGKLDSLNEESVIDASIDSRIETHTEERSKTVTHRRKGFDRLFHLSSWFNPTYETTEYYDVEVEEEIKFVSREKLSNQLVAPIRKTLKAERTRILEFAEEKTKNIKEYFFKQFDKVDNILAKKTSELHEATTSKEASEKALKNANDLLKQLEDVKAKLAAILEI